MNYLSFIVFNLTIQLLFFGELQVVGVPVTLNGDLKNQFVETDVGFDTICKVDAH